MSAVSAAPRPRRLKPMTVVGYALLLVVAVFYLVPVYVMVVTSLKSFVEVSHTTP